ncbi:hypothetical protein [Actinacidiphila guanduensis]|jgi:hypothetical protein|uniref:VWA domain-containing protein n=1 Tax=Actinacidiphila guanduensis TaxID=310781 RepID=A0A1H0I5T3_9ACTN|nr:hypothetical protein [Actinacidiphila guanduensis]SDO26779.1 hypothetical protein SAMN05216259_108354 [Actinacidiphila guanduensis]
MGSGSWSTNVYDAAERYRRAAGTGAFAYSDSVKSRTSRSGWSAHPSLDPKGLTVRESRDSQEHPTSLAISVLFDVTGSMGGVPRVLQTKLPDLFGLLLRKGYTAHPQILFGAVGDATCDRVPLQLGQFESDNRMDEQLGNILLEGGGGGQMSESYELAMYAMARHTALDCHEKRGRRGYLFLIGDELPYGRVKSREVRAVLGDSVAEDIPLPVILAELRRKFHVFYILPAGASYAGNQEVLGVWRKLLGQNVIELDDLDAVCETIALTVGLGEEAIDLAAGLADLADIGSTAGPSVARALAPLDR